MKILLGQAETYGQTCKSGSVLEGVRNKRVRRIALEEELCAQTLAEGVISSEVDVDFVLSGRDLIVVLINTTKHCDIALESQVEFQNQVVLDIGLLSVAAQGDDVERKVFDAISCTDDDFATVHLSELVVGETQRHVSRFPELEIECHGVMQADINTNERQVLLCKHHLRDIVWRNDDV